MNDGLIPMRYAKAIYEVAQEKACAKQVYNLMKEIVSVFATRPQLQSTLSNPYIAVSDKIALLGTIAKASDADPRFVDDICRLLARNGRIDLTRDIAAAYIRLYRKINRIYEVKIVSAAPMSEAESNRLLSLIENHLKGGTMEISYFVDPALIGGFSVSVGNERIDASISNELKQLRLNLIKK